MNKRWIPLFVIALGVATVATLVFYGLVTSGLAGVEAKSGELPASAGPAAAAGAIPVGMRAISIRVAQADGLLEMIQPHYRVDVQAVYGPPDRLELRTIVQDVEVLAVPTVAAAPPARGTIPVVILVTTPAAADLIALADTAARLRLTVRNAADRDGSAKPSIGMAAVMKPEPPPAQARQGGPAVAPGVPAGARATPGFGQPAAPRP